MAYQVGDLLRFHLKSGVIQEYHYRTTDKDGECFEVTWNGTIQRVHFSEIDRVEKLANDDTSKLR